MAVISDSKAVIFDLDGVLVDTAQAHRQAWYDLAAEQGVPMSDEFFYNTFGMQNYQILPMLLGVDLSEEQIEQLSRWKERRYREIVVQQLRPVQGAHQLLSRLKDARFHLAVGSSAPRENLELILQRAHFATYFDTYVTSEDVSNGKPAPDTFLKAAERLQVAPRCCVVVEDAVPGIQAARAARMAVVAVTTSRSRQDLAEADIVVDSLAELGADDFIRLIEG